MRKIGVVLLVGLAVSIISVTAFLRVRPVWKASEYVPIALIICDFYKDNNRLPDNFDELKKWSKTHWKISILLERYNIEFNKDPDIPRLLESREDFVMIRGDSRESANVNAIVRDFVRSNLSLEAK